MFDWITGVLQSFGYVGIAFLMMAENVFPPIPSELIMPLAGFTAAQGRLNPVLVVLSGTIGSMGGALFWYWVGRRLGLKRLKRLASNHGRWFTVSPDDLDHACRWFQSHGGSALLMGRLIPAVRTLISIPAGIAEIPLPRLIMFSTIGTLAWNTLLVAAGFLLQSSYGVVAKYVDPVTTLVLVGSLGWYLYRVATWRPHVEGLRGEDK